MSILHMADSALDYIEAVPDGRVLVVAYPMAQKSEMDAICIYLVNQARARFSESLLTVWPRQIAVNEATVVLVRGMESHLGTVRGMEFDMAIVDPCVSLENYAMVRSRVRPRHASPVG